MVKFLAVWVIFQFIVIGQVVGEMAYEMDQWTYICDERDMTLWEIKFALLVLPLLAFADGSDIAEYCGKQRAEK